MHLFDLFEEMVRRVRWQKLGLGWAVGFSTCNLSWDVGSEKMRFLSPGWALKNEENNKCKIRINN